MLSECDSIHLDASDEYFCPHCCILNKASSLFPLCKSVGIINEGSSEIHPMPALKWIDELTLKTLREKEGQIKQYLESKLSLYCSLLREECPFVLSL
jgi:hypothetical protein